MSAGPHGVTLSILMVSYNAVDHLRHTLGELMDASAPSVSHEVLVTDNASADGAADVAEQVLGASAVVRLGRNTGFAFAVNRTAERAVGDYLLLLNPDACPLPGSLDAAVEHLRGRGDRGIVGGRCVNAFGDLEPRSCFGRITAWSATCWATGLSVVFRGSRWFDPESLGGWQRDDVREVDVVSGGFLLIARDTWLRLGGFDETYLIYGEDQDLCLRAARGGDKPSIEPDAVFRHAIGASSSARADRDVLVLTGRATVARLRLGRSSGYVRYSAKVGVAVRALAETALRRPGRWREVWRRRAEWAGGWTARSAPLEAAATVGGSGA